jgi:dUTPase
MAYFDVIKNDRVDVYQRLVQICAPDLKPFKVEIVDSLDQTERGDGGFGSTGV